ncbi:MAG: hypothetical protein EP343_16155 [Deltaproteobacteria bacterium]|nr:MAG: hypothetical protein EP343_16155 [Deltaproteobacteria bacterium]
MSVMSTPPGPVVFVLRPADWEAQDYVVNRNIIGDHLHQNAAAKLPLASLAYDGQDKYHRILQSNVADEAHRQALFDKATEHINNIDFPWEEVEVNGAQAITCAHEFAAESVMSPVHLASIQERLGTVMVSVSIARRGYIMYVANDMSELHQQASLALSFTGNKHFLKAPDTDKVSPEIFMMMSGQIVGIQEIEGSLELRDEEGNVVGNITKEEYTELELAFSSEEEDNDIEEESFTREIYINWSEMSPLQRSKLIQSLNEKGKPTFHKWSYEADLDPLHYSIPLDWDGWPKMVAFFVVLMGMLNVVIDVYRMLVGYDHIPNIYLQSSWVKMSLYVGFFVWLVRAVTLLYRDITLGATPFEKGTYLYSTAVLGVSFHAVSFRSITEGGMVGTIERTAYDTEGKGMLWSFQYGGDTHVFDFDDKDQLQRVIQAVEEEQQFAQKARDNGDLETASQYDPLALYERYEFEEEEGFPLERWRPGLPNWLKEPTWVILLLGISLGVGFSTLRDWRMDTEFFKHIRTQAHVNLYEVRGGRYHKDDIEKHILPVIRLKQTKKENTLKAYRDYLQTKPPATLAKEAKASIHKLYEEAIQRFKTQASKSNPQLMPFIQRLLKHLEATQSPYVRVTFQAPTEKALQRMDDKLQKSKAQLTKLQALIKTWEKRARRRRNRRRSRRMLRRLRAMARRYQKVQLEPVAPHFTQGINQIRESEIGAILNKSFQTIFPKDILQLTGKNVAPARSGGSIPATAPTLLVSYQITPTSRRYSSKRNPNRVFVGIQVQFTIKFSIPSSPPPLRFNLTVNPPHKFSVTSYVSKGASGLNDKALLQDPKVQKLLRRPMSDAQLKAFAKRLFARQQNSQGGRQVDADSVYSKMATLAFQQLRRKLRDSFFAPDSQAFRRWKVQP